MDNEEQKEKPCETFNCGKHCAQTSLPRSTKPGG